MHRYWGCIFFAATFADELSSHSSASSADEAPSSQQRQQRSVLLRREAEEDPFAVLAEAGKAENAADQEPGGAHNMTPAGGFVGGVTPFSRRRDTVIINRNSSDDQTLQTKEGAIRIIGNRTVWSEGPGGILGPFHEKRTVDLGEQQSMMQPAVRSMDPTVQDLVVNEAADNSTTATLTESDEDEDNYVDDRWLYAQSSPGFISGVSLQPDPWTNLGCFQRLKNDNAVLRDVPSPRDATCANFDTAAEEFNTGTKQPRCRSGLPFYRLIATDMSPGVCQGYCLSKGLDLCGLVEGIECRCGATSRVHGLWGMRPLPIHLRFQEEEHQVPIGSDCDIVAYMYVGELPGHLVPAEQLSRTALDFAYLQAVGCSEGGCLDPSAAP
jgi:hypothetical protein